MPYGQKVTPYLTIPLHNTQMGNWDDPCPHLMSSLVMKIFPIEAHYAIQE
jgi:hypothetical protein